MRLANKIGGRLQSERAVVVKNCAFASLQLADEALVPWCPGGSVVVARSSQSLQYTFTGSTMNNKQAIKSEREGNV